MAATTTGASTLANGNNRISGEASSSRYTADNSYTEPQSNAQKATTQHLEASNQMPSTQRQWWPAPGYGPSAYGPMGNPLARQQTNGTTDTEILQAFGGDFQPGLYKRPKSKVANPAPLGLAGFALTTFVLSCINLGTRGLSAPNIVVGPAFAYGGLCQLLAGMWELALGNTFGGWALPSYGGFWISLGIIFTPGGFDIAASYGGETASFYKAFGLYIFGWFIVSLSPLPPPALPCLSFSHCPVSTPSYCSAVLLLTALSSLLLPSIFHPLTSSHILSQDLLRAAPTAHAH